MTIDLFILIVVVVFSLIGAYTGAARQIAQLVGLVAAFSCARPIGTFFGPRIAQSLGTPQSAGVVVGTLVTFIVVLVAVRFILTQVLRSAFAGREEGDRQADRVLGFLLGALKVTALSYVVLSALTFAERNITVAGRRLGLSPADSYAFAVARSYNLFELTQFSPVKDLVAVADAAQDPKRRARLTDDPAFRSVQQDPRFRRVLEDQGLRKALERGDYQQLLRSNAVLQLIQDRDFAARLGAAADAVPAEPPPG